MLQNTKENTNDLERLNHEITNEALGTIEEGEHYINAIFKIKYQRFYIKAKIWIGSDFHFEDVALIDTGAEQNCLQEGLIPTQYYEKMREKLYGANHAELDIEYKLTKAYVCNEGFCFKNTCILAKDLDEKIILGIPFISQLKPFGVDDDGIWTKMLGTDICCRFVDICFRFWEEIWYLTTVGSLLFCNYYSLGGSCLPPLKW